MVIKLNRMGVLGIGSLRLMPGINLNVDEAEWGRWKDNPVIKNKIEEGEIEVMLQEDPGNGEDLSISKMNAKNAIVEIKNATDLELLEEWKTGETRVTVLEAIDSQIEEINSEPETRDRSKTGEDPTK